MGPTVIWSLQDLNWHSTYFFLSPVDKIPIFNTLGWNIKNHPQTRWDTFLKSYLCVKRSGYSWPGCFLECVKEEKRLEKEKERDGVMEREESVWAHVHIPAGSCTLEGDSWRLLRGLRLLSNAHADAHVVTSARMCVVLVLMWQMGEKGWVNVTSRDT